MIWRRLNIVGGGILLKDIMVICLLENWCWWVVFYVNGNSSLIKWLFWRVIKTNKVASLASRKGNSVDIDRHEKFVLEAKLPFIKLPSFSYNLIPSDFINFCLRYQILFILSFLLNVVISPVTFVSPIPLVLPKKRTPKSSTTPSVIWMYIMPWCCWSSLNNHIYTVGHVFNDVVLWMTIVNYFCWAL